MCTLAAANTDLKLQTCTFQKQLFFSHLQKKKKNRTPFSTDKKIAATKLPLVFAKCKSCSKFSAFFFFFLRLQKRLWCQYLTRSKIRKHSVVAKIRGRTEAAKVYVCSRKHILLDPILYLALTKICSWHSWIVTATTANDVYFPFYLYGAIARRTSHFSFELVWGKLLRNERFWSAKKSPSVDTGKHRLPCLYQSFLRLALFLSKATLLNFF